MNRNRWRDAALALALAVLATPLAAQQTYTLQGLVRAGETGEGLPGAQVVVVGTDFGSLTDNAGRYAVRATLTPGQYQVEISLIGRSPVRQDVTLGSQRVVTLPPVTLETTALELEGIVVTGTAAPTAKRALGNNVSSVDESRLDAAPATTLDQAMQGNIAGAVITANTGTPGGGVSVRLRGTSSIIAGAEPLYIIDGVIIDNSSDQQINFGYRSNPSNRLADLDPRDIERIEILKGAAAAALYGSRANNGVVQIFTKRGSAGAPKVTFSTRLSREDLPNKIDFALTPVDTDGNPVERFDHQDLIFRDVWNYDSSLQLSGGSEDTQYFMSANWVDQEGIMIGSGHRKLNLRMNLDQRIGMLKLSGGANLVRSNTDLLVNGEHGLGGVLTAIVFTPTTTDLAEKNPETGEYVNRAFVFPNPLAVIEDWDANQVQERFIGSFQATADPTPWLNLQYRLGYDSYTMETDRFIPRGEAFAPLGQAMAVVRDNSLLNNDLVGSANYTLGEGMRFTTSAGMNHTFSRTHTVFASAEDLSLLTELVRGAVQSASESIIETATLGFFGQQQVAWRNRLFLTGAMRWDASSTFGADERWQLYPKLSGSYVVSDEAFFQNSPLGDFMSELRLRGALGWAGNQPPTGEAYARFPRYGQVTNIDRLGLVNLSNAGNPNLKPERQREYELGLDASFLEDRLGVGFTYYDQRTEDLLTSRPFAPSSGYGFTLDNVGVLTNTGLELELNTLNINREDFRWSSTLIYSTNQNEVEELFGDPFTAGYNNRVQEGEELGAFYMWAYERDQDGNIVEDEVGPVRASERQIVGSPWPDWTGSLLNEFRYGDFTASILLDGQFGHEVWNQSRRIMDIFSAGPLYDQQLKGEVTSDYRWRIIGIWEAYLEDASFVKVRNITVRYRLPESITSMIGAATIDLELSGRNLYTFTDYSGYDPEVNMFGTLTVARGVDFAVYPHSRSMAFGVRVNY